MTRAPNDEVGKPVSSPVREPRNFLEQHALAALTAEPSWTVTMYAVYNDLTDDDHDHLREFLRGHLPASQLR